MADLLTLKECLEATEGILFDAEALVSLFKDETRRGPRSELLVRIPARRRFTSLVARFEFICDIAQDEVRQRRRWLEDRSIHVLRVTEPISMTFEGLVGAAAARCDLLSDLLIAATAKSRDLAVASADRDFRGMGGIILVAEFAQPR